MLPLLLCSRMFMLARSASVFVFGVTCAINSFAMDTKLKTGLQGSFHLSAKTKAITSANHNWPKQCNEPIRIQSNRRKARENARARGVIGFGFHWLKKWHEFCWPITERSNAKKQTQFTIYAQLKTAPSQSDFIIMLITTAVMFYELLKETGLSSFIIL